jgi:hypothetical protein
LSRLRVVPIVEGHGEDNSIRILLQRIWDELLGGDYVDVVKPIRGKRLKLVKTKELERALNLALLKLRATDFEGPAMILVLLDADSDLPCVLGPDLLSLARSVRADADVSSRRRNLSPDFWTCRAPRPPKIQSDPATARDGFSGDSGVSNTARPSISLR